MFLRKLFNVRIWGYGLFWSWNLIFLAFMALGFAPQLLPGLIDSVRVSQSPPEFLLYASMMTLIPLASVVLGLTALRREPGKLLIYGYGVEGPLMVLLLMRFFVVRQATPAISLMLALAAVGLVAMLWQILDRKIDERGRIAAAARLVGLTLMLLTGIYAALWLTFYIVPLSATLLEALGAFLAELPRILAEIWRTLTRPGWWQELLRQWTMIPFTILGLTIGLYSATLLIVMPIAVTVIYARSWLSAFRAMAGRAGKPTAAVLAGVAAAASIILVALANRQPQQHAFALLAQPPASPSEALALLDRQDELRAGLLNAYLAPQRYISAVGEVRHVREIYERSLGLPTPQAIRVQNLYEGFARPLLYQPVEPPQPAANWDNQAFQKEPTQAAELYETFFDESIVEGEHDVVVQAVRSTWNIDQATTAWQAIDDREVQLLRQEVNVTEHGDWADVELYEEYENATGLRQEVVYYFSLPESAVVTGVWLGNSPDRDRRFQYRVSPRGAAQAVYRSEVRRQVDPALVEQIGPRQYRLRIFPVEPKRVHWDQGSMRSTIDAAPPLHMWLTYRTLRQADGWPLPQMSEKRNVFWDDATARLVNGQPMIFGNAAPDKTWLPASAPAAVAAPSLSETIVHRVDFSGGQTVVARPAQMTQTPALPDDLRLAVVLDRSRSMARQQQGVEASFQRLLALGAAGATIDLYLTASPFRGEAPSIVRLEDFSPKSVIYFGGQNAAELLAQFAALHRDRSYDAVLVLTDGSGYSLGEGVVTVPTPDAPVWMVHLGGFPLGYDDPTLDAIQASGGGATASVDEALTRLAASLAARDARRSEEAQPFQPVADIIDGYEWLTLSTEMADAQGLRSADADSDAGVFAPLAARRLILTEMQRNRGEIADLALLDRLHALASEYSIVTPLSSMIVLVDQAQHRLLDRLESQSDRFQREFEDVGETAPLPPVIGVPEPEEWLLIAVAVGMAAWYAYTAQRHRRRRTA
jgi:putative PEP-CTERM system integral membrane protein